MNSRTSIALIALSLIAGAGRAQVASVAEWKFSEGGNGHVYGLYLFPGSTWDQCRSRALSMGGDLVSITSSAEKLIVDTVIVSLGCPAEIDPRKDVWLGAKAEPGQPWVWVDGSIWSYTAWGSGLPNNSGLERRFLVEKCPILGWDDYRDSEAFGYMRGAIIEWSADCNSDGVVDYAQILRGEVADLNTNGVPDICETSISSVMPPSIPAQGGSTVTIRGNGFPASPSVMIGGVPATNVLRVSAAQITATSPAVMPGMKSVSVNGFTLPDGIYIRPECGSDLDQNGSVDAGDISIILLDFGPCYEPPAALAAPAPIPLLADEPAQKPTQR